MKDNARLLPILCWSAFAGWAATIFWLSSQAPPELEDFGPWFMKLVNVDKFAHFVAFSAGAVSLALALRVSSATLSVPTLTWLAIGGISLFGAVDEWHQLSTPGRSGADLGDWLADTAGAVAGSCGFFYFYAGFRTPKSARARGEPAPGN